MTDLIQFARETGIMSEKQADHGIDEDDDAEATTLREEHRYRPLNFHERPRSDAEEVPCADDPENPNYEPNSYDEDDLE